jgi:hypothetical protein
MVVLTSAIAIAGKNLTKSRNSVKKIPSVPTKIAISIMVGLYISQLEGK